MQLPPQNYDNVIKLAPVQKQLLLSEDLLVVEDSNSVVV